MIVNFPLGILLGFSFLIIHDYTPAKIKVLVFDVDEAAGLDIRQTVGRMAHNELYILCECCNLLPRIVILSNSSFISDIHVGVLLI